MLYHCVPPRLSLSSLFFFNDTATTEIYTLSLHDALPIYLVEPHLPVQLVEAAAERREKRIRVARRHLAAEHGDAGRVHRHDEGRAVAVAIHSGVGADVDVLGIDRARVHPDLAAQHEAGARLPADAKGGPLAGILAEPVADGGRAGREREEAAGGGDQLAVTGGAGDLLRRDLPLLDDVEDAQRDEVAITGRVGHVAGGEEDRRRVAPAHRPEVGRGLRQREGPRRPHAIGVGRHQQDVAPLGIAMTVVPRDVLVHHRRRGRMDRHVLDEALAHDPNPPAVAHGVSILAAGSHGAYRIAMLKSSAVLDLYTELRPLAAALNAADIPYGLAGGLAVSLYTTPRATEDIDVLVAAADVDRVVHVAAPLGFRKSGRRIRRANGRIEIQRLVKIDGADLLPLDLMVIVDPGLRDAVQGRTEKVIEDQRLSVVSVDALVVLKRLRNSNRDLGDLDALREIGRASCRE